MDTNTPETQRSAIAIHTMLQDAGFGVLDDAPPIRTYSDFHSASTSNVLGYATRMDEVLGQLQTAGDADDKRQVLADIQTLVNETAPMAVTGPYLLCMPFADNIRGASSAPMASRCSTRRGPLSDLPASLDRSPNSRRRFHAAQILRRPIGLICTQNLN